MGDNTGAQVGTVRIGGANVVVNGAFNYGADAQASDTYVLDLAVDVSAYVAGLQIFFEANTANTGTATIAVDGLAATTIHKRAATVLADGDIPADSIAHLVYDADGEFQLMNPVVN